MAGIIRILCNISTHALTEGDSFISCGLYLYQIFQLTPSRRATFPQHQEAHCVYISTHALTEGDRTGS